MRESRAICLLCRARQSVQLAARRGAGFEIRNRGRWHTTAAATGSTSSTGTSTSGNEASDGTQSHRPASEDNGGLSGTRRRQQGSALSSTSTHRSPRSRVIKHRPTEDAALALFRDIVENQKSHEGGQLKGRPKEKHGKQVHDEEDGGLNELAQQLDEAHLEELQREHHDHQEQPSVGRDATASVELYNQLVKLTQLRTQPETTTATLFHHFETNMYPLMTDATRELPTIFRQTAHQLIREVSKAKVENIYADDLPSVAQITQIRRQFDLLNMPEPWTPLIMGLATEIVQPANPSNADKITALVEDLVEAWRMFTLPDIVVADKETLEGTPATEFRVPMPDAARVNRYARRGSIQLGLSLLFPRYAPAQLRKLAPAVLASYAILADPAIRTPEIDEKAHELTEAVKNILASIVIKRRVVADMYESHPVLGTYVLGRWPLVGGSTGGEQQTQNQRAPIAKSSRDGRRATLESIHKQLDQALRVRNIQACEAAWDRFWSAVSLPDVEGPERLRGSGDTLDYFIMAFTTLRMSDRAIAVWNLMSMAGIKPTLRTWTAFIDGFKRSNNPAGIHNIWERLIASGIQVDTAVWTARISGLIQSGAAEEGIQALEEMQRLWLESEREGKLAAEVAAASGSSSTPATNKKEVQRPKAVKPTIEPVNAAIAGMLRRGDLVAAKRVLGWAGRHGIEPDVITFNTILRPLVRDGAVEEVAGLLEMMRQRNIRPDEATITILLDDTIGGGAMAGRSPSEQAEIVKQVLADVEAAGLDANQQNYAKIIYLLLRNEERARNNAVGRTDRTDHAEAAVAVVFQRMRQRGIPMSSHIYTILAEHYFMRNPPDLEAVRYLIENGQPGGLSLYEAKTASESEATEDGATTTSTASADATDSTDASVESGSQDSAARASRPAPTFDRVFWERIVRGFSQVGDTASAQKYFAHIADSVSVTSSTLEDLLRALIRNKEWEAAAQLVAKVQAQKMPQVQTMGGKATRLTETRQFRHRFWHLAAEYGLLHD